MLLGAKRPKWVSHRVVGRMNFSAIFVITCPSGFQKELQIPTFHRWKFIWVNIRKTQTNALNFSVPIWKDS